MEWGRKKEDRPGKGRSNIYLCASAKRLSHRFDRRFSLSDDDDGNRFCLQIDPLFCWPSVISLANRVIAKRRTSDQRGGKAIDLPRKRCATTREKSSLQLPPSGCCRLHRHEHFCKGRLQTSHRNPTILQSPYSACWGASARMQGVCCRRDSQMSVPSGSCFGASIACMCGWKRSLLVAVGAVGGTCSTR